jgi:D-3-phosphoglycerate dehydrogenase
MPGCPRLTYFESWTDPVANEIFGEAAAREPSSTPELIRLEVFGDIDRNWQTLEATHGYQALFRTEASRRPGVAEQWLAGADLVSRCPELLAVCSAGAGYDVIDVNACSEAGVIVCNNSGPGAEAVAEHALGFMLDLAKRITLADRGMRSGSLLDRTTVRGCELAGKTLGVVGLGRIGSRLVELCAPFHMEVLAFDPYLPDEKVRARGATPVTFEELLEQADFVQVTCPLSPETEGLFDASAFARMKEGSFFITTARGQVHDEQALYASLAKGHLAGAGLDVFHEEPTPPDHPLLGLDNVVASPHVAGITDEATRAIAVATAEQWLLIFAGEVPPRLINPGAWSRYRERFHQALGRWPKDLEC